MSRLIDADVLSDRMNDRDKDRIECAIRHIQSSLDVDPWACEIAVEAMKKQLEIIRCTDCKWYEGDIMANPWGVCCHPSWVDGNSGHEVLERGWCYRAERREG